MINNSKNIAPFKLVFTKALSTFIIVISLWSCGNSKDAITESSFSERIPFKTYFHQANSEKMIGHNERAIELFNQCLTIEPDNHAVHFALSDLYEAKGDAEKTLSYAEKAYTLDKKNKWYTLRLADLYFKAKNYSKTADLYGTIIAEEKNIDLKFKYTDALIRSERYEEALVMLEEIEVETGKIREVSFTKHDLLIELEKPEEAQKELNDLMKENPGDTDIKIMVADFFMNQNNFLKAEEIILPILAKDSTNGQAYIMMADIKLRQNNVNEAFSNLAKGFKDKEVEIERKLEIIGGLIPYTAKNQRDHTEMISGVQNLFTIIYDPALKNNKLHSYYGFFMATTENLEKAEKEYQLACDIDASSFNAWLQLLSIEDELNYFDKMFANGQNAAEIFPSQPIIYLLTGIGAKETKKYIAAEEWFFLGKDLVVQDAPLQSEFLYQLGDMSYKMGNPDEGKFYFNQAIEAFNGNVNVYISRANQLFKQGLLDEAEIEINKGITAVPKNAALHDLHGQILFEKKDYKGAENAFLQALYDDYYDGTVLEHYADALYFTKDKDKAIEVWKEAIKYGNDSPVLLRKYKEEKYYAPE